MKKTKKIRKKKTKFPNIKIKRYGSKLLFCYNFNLRALYKYMEISKKTGLALEKFLNCGKESLSNEEKNILYKLKAYPFKKVEERVRYLKAKKDCIELLHYLDF